MNILFAGNSLTYYNDMPWLLHEMEAARGRSIYVRQMTRGGGYLAELLFGNSEHHRRFCFDLKEKKWDWVVLQDQTINPCENPAQFHETVTRLAAQVRQAGSKPALYATWAYKPDSDLLPENSTTYEAMRDGLAAAYCKAGEANEAPVIPVGLLFDAAGKTLPEIELYNPDCRHPSLAGSFLCAAAFDRFLLGAEEPSAYVPEELDVQTAQKLWKLVLSWK
ncbi:MAG: hypothetical protein MJ118_01950 [Clostridia bacterium]|nr:hypothetical protein [Clostridia bacterium]